ALGQPGNVLFANGVTTNYQYYIENNRLLGIETAVGMAGLQKLTYGYDSKGNILAIADDTDPTDTTRNQAFTYDHRDRLTRAESPVYGGTAGRIIYRYDEIGNMTYNSKMGTYTYGGPQPHAVLQAGSLSYSYDPNGNMITRNGKAITYDYDNRPVSIAYGTANGTVASVYDYTGQRVKKITPGATILSFGKHFECTVGGACTKYIFDGERIIAQKTGSSVLYYHTDHLGSTGVITDQEGVKVQEIYYFPYGKVRANTGSVTPYKYTGQEEDAETGLDYYNARFYDPNLGRFITADTIVPDPSDPQDLNRYSYCGNNPVNYVDPTGHEEMFIWMGGYKDSSPSYYSSSSGYGSSVTYGDVTISVSVSTGDPFSSMSSYSHGSGNSGGSGSSSTAVTSAAQYGTISSAPSFPQSLMNSLYTDFYSLTHDDGPSSQIDMVMGILSLATDVIGGPEKEGAVVAAKMGKKALEEIGKEASSSIKRFLNKAPKGAINSQVEKNGKFLRVSYEVPGSAGGESRAIYTKFVNDDGKTLKIYKDSYDRAGYFQHRKFKFISTE
ncbi:MAG: RHS repeat-associated core domain-containing protein, partial [Thermodesulfovibrionales bacterium]